MARATGKKRPMGEKGRRCCGAMKVARTMGLKELSRRSNCDQHRVVEDEKRWGARRTEWATELVRST